MWPERRLALVFHHPLKRVLSGDSPRVVAPDNGITLLVVDLLAEGRNMKFPGAGLSTLFEELLHTING